MNLPLHCDQKPKPRAQTPTRTPTYGCLDIFKSSCISEFSYKVFKGILVFQHSRLTFFRTVARCGKGLAS